MSINQEAEKGILSLMLTGNKKIIAKIETEINKDDIYIHKHKQLFEILTRLDSIDVISVSSAIEKQGITDDLPSAYISALSDSGSSVSSLDYYINTLRESSSLRQYKAMLTHVNNMLEDKESSEMIKTYVEQEVIKIAKHGSSRTVKTYREILNETMKEIQENAENGIEIAGIKTGFKDIDRMIGGLRGGQMITIAGRTGMGKTAFAMAIAKNIAMQKKHTLVFSLEMTDRELCYRDLSRTAGLKLRDLKRAKLSEKRNEWKMLADAYNESLNATLYIDDTGSNTIEKIKSIARLHMLNYGLDCIIMDHGQIAKSIQKFNGRTELVNYIANEVMSIAKELGVPFIFLSQIKRLAQGIADKRPTLEDLKQSGAIEENSHVVMLLYRDDYYNRETSEYKNQIEIDIAKSRDGMPGVARLYCNLENMEFKDFEGRF